MAPELLALALISMAIGIPMAQGFGARLELPLSFHQGGCSNRGGSSLWGVENEDRRETRVADTPDEAVSFSQLLDAIDFPPSANENLNAFSLAHKGNRNKRDDMFSHLQDRADILALESFEVSLSRPETLDDCGEDCQECLIPEEWKDFPMTVKPTDVMDFLGISRVQPLKAPVPSPRPHTP